jgi:transposase
MHYPISVGLDVHLSSIAAAAYFVESGEVAERSFAGDDAQGIIEWVSSFGVRAQTVYESGFCGFTLKRKLDDAGIPCKIAAISKLAKPTGDKVKTDKRDARFLARQLACNNITAVHVPTIEREGMRDTSRALCITRSNLAAAKQRVIQSHHRYGLRYPGTRGAWTKDWLAWAKPLKMPSKGAQIAYDCHMATALRLIDEKKELEQTIALWLEDGSVKWQADALCAIKGVSKAVAFCLIAELGDLSRFSSAAGLASYLGLTPSENSSGKSVRRGNMTRTGNEHARKALIEAAWCFSRMKTPYKAAPEGLGPEVSAHAAKANRRLLKRRQHLMATKKPCVANAATARELASWDWAISVMAGKDRQVQR